jgi:signal recognition particle GTPase
MKPAAMLLLLTGLNGLGACTTVGNGHMKLLTQNSSAEVLVPGQTSRADVERLLGKGNAFHFDSGSVTRYGYTSTKASICRNG